MNKLDFQFNDYYQSWGHTGDCPEGCTCDMSPEGRQRRKEWEERHSRNTYYRAEDMYRQYELVRLGETKLAEAHQKLDRLSALLDQYESQLACADERLDKYAELGMRIAEERDNLRTTLEQIAESREFYGEPLRILARQALNGKEEKENT